VSTAADIQEKKLICLTSIKHYFKIQRVAGNKCLRASTVPIHLSQKIPF
jgi:hypothetical protein